MKLDTLKQGYAALNAGAWVEGIPTPLFDGVSFKVARLFNPAFNDLYDKLTAEPLGDLSKEQHDARAMDECLARHALLDWKGIDDAYTPEVGLALLADSEAGAAFRRAIYWSCDQLPKQIKAKLEADVKN